MTEAEKLERAAVDAMLAVDVENGAKADMYQLARAAISVTLEAAARVAEGATFPEPQATEPTMRVLEQGIIQGGKTTAKNIAAAIRALAPEENRKV